MSTNAYNKDKEITDLKKFEKEISWKNHSPEDMPKVVFDTYFVEKSIHP